MVTKIETISFLTIGFLTIGLLLTACQGPTSNSQSLGELTSAPANVRETALEGRELERIQEANVKRWQLMGDSYSSLTNAASEQGVLANQARWDAMAEHYAALVESRPESSSIADQARWDAMAEHYAALANSRPESAVVADQARWDAKGYVYQGLGQDPEQIIADFLSAISDNDADSALALIARGATIEDSETHIGLDEIRGWLNDQIQYNLIFEPGQFERIDRALSFTITAKEGGRVAFQTKAIAKVSEGQLDSLRIFDPGS